MVLSGLASTKTFLPEQLVGPVSHHVELKLAFPRERLPALFAGVLLEKRTIRLDFSNEFKHFSVESLDVNESK